ncbi:DUF4382 domain-containing protein [Flavobacterium sp. GT3R68]|uniref:DUF4382 domain-containing protein n=1 Tax=Flavobacterium sp. GT3R68 TaxID=2594437 RepID=UPI000F862637|nr:DUF4382 domain-containing protein [Flavobacterium sp. GT3R68]RTY95826.1 DUF4382 domain-containing protein [Flavobacterium sp. GSN2]TRW93598.1 DUF4382 domain-containing protein [Flavobacterium sp. GT3R68]
MKKVQNFTAGFLVIAFFSLFLSCADNDNSAQTSRITVRMTDAPGDYDEVNVEVIDVLIKTNANSDEGGWVSIGNITPGIYNLLDLSGGVNVLLADNNVPSGHLGQIRLLLGDENTVVVDGVSHVLNTPSAQQSGLKLLINQELVGGATYDFLLDFDVENSVVVEAGGSGNYNLHPVIHVSTTANSGVIKGTVAPIGLQILASVQVGDITVSSYANADGVFQLNGIPAGTYTVTLTPDVSSGLSASIINNVVVTNGQITNMGSLTIP